MSRNVTFGAWLREARKEAGMSQRTLAPLLQVTNSYISKIEAGTKPPPGEETLNLIASTLSISPDDVYRRAGRVPQFVVRAFDRGISDDEFSKLKSLITPKIEPRTGLTFERSAWVNRFLSSMNLKTTGDWYQTRSLKTVRDVIRPGSSTASGWGQIVIDNYGWTLYHVNAGEIAHAQWEEALQ